MIIEHRIQGLIKSGRMTKDGDFVESEHPRDPEGKFAESGGSSLPPRSANTMSEAIAMSSPSGSMTNRAKEAATQRLSESLFGKGGMKEPSLPKQPDKKESLLQQAKELRGLAERGMKPRAYLKKAEELESEAASLGSKTEEPTAKIRNYGFNTSEMSKNLKWEELNTLFEQEWNNPNNITTPNNYKPEAKRKMHAILNALRGHKAGEKSQEIANHIESNLRGLPTESLGKSINKFNNRNEPPGGWGEEDLV